nr:mediator of DNA damage checkpoint protein 1-like [Drosophila suzukii]
MNSKDIYSLGKPAEMEKTRRYSSNPEDASSISTEQPATLRRVSVESDLRNSSLVGRIPETWGHIKGRKTIRAPDTPERAPRTRNISSSPKTPRTSKQPKTPRSAKRVAGLVKQKYAHIKGRKQIQAPSSPTTEPQSSLKTPTTPKGSPKTTTPKKHPESSPKTPKMSPHTYIEINCWVPSRWKTPWSCTNNNFLIRRQSKKIPKRQVQKSPKLVKNTE